MSPGKVSEGDIHIPVIYKGTDECVEYLFCLLCSLHRKLKAQALRHETAHQLFAAQQGQEGREIAAIHPNMVVKIPMTVEGLKAVKALHAEGIKTNVTLVFTSAQALLAARAGASYVSPFLGRLDDISMPGIDLIYDITEIFQMHNIETEIIAASVRNPIHVIDCAKAGADIATVPYKVLEQMTKHPLTDQGIAKFQADYKAVFGE